MLLVIRGIYCQTVVRQVGLYLLQALTLERSWN